MRTASVSERMAPAVRAVAPVRVAAAARTGRWSDEVRDHCAACADCAETAMVTADRTAAVVARVKTAARAAMATAATTTVRTVTKTAAMATRAIENDLTRRSKSPFARRYPK